MKRRDKLEKELRVLTSAKDELQNLIYMMDRTIEIIEDKLKNKSNEWLDKEED
jgi:hypothetical protein